MDLNLGSTYIGDRNTDGKNQTAISNLAKADVTKRFALKKEGLCC